MMSAPFVLGIDGGGSKTLLALADRSGRLVRMVRGAGVNPVDNSNWRTELAGLVAALDLDGSSPAHVTAALPAHGEVAALSRAQEEAIAGFFPNAPATVVNDVDAAHFGAFAGGAGILILSGSGSMAWARAGGGRSWRVGGWGDLIGDEGSAYWIGRRLLSLVSQGLDGRADAPGLVAAVSSHLDLDRENAAESLAGWAARLAHPRSAVAALAELVGQQAALGDNQALAILEAAAEELQRHWTAVAAKTPGGARLPWSYAGGVLTSPLMREMLARRIGRAPFPPRLPPIGGALLHAARRAHWPVKEAWIERLAAAIEAEPAGKPELIEASAI